MFQRHSALGSEVLQYGLAYFSNFVNTRSARQYIAIFLKVCWFVCFYLFFIPVPLLLFITVKQWYYRWLLTSRSQREWRTLSTGLVSLHPVVKELQQLRFSSVAWTVSHHQKSVLNPEEPGWPLLQADKKWEKPVGNQSPIPPNPQLHSQFNQRLQPSHYHIVIFNTAWAQWDKPLTADFHICSDKCQDTHGTLSSLCPWSHQCKSCWVPLQGVPEQIQDWFSSAGVGLQDCLVCQSDILCLKGNKINAVLPLTIPIPLILFLGLYLFFMLKILFA